MTATKQDTSRSRLAWAISAPLGFLVLAYAAWAISDRLLYVGPFDRAQFGWLVVIPLVTAAPVVEAFTWRSLSDGQSLVAASVVGLAVGVTAAVLFGIAVAGSADACQFGSRLSGTDVVIGSAVVGLVTGGGYAGSGAMAAIVMRRGHPGIGALIGAVGGFLTIWVAAFAGFAVFGFIGICNRPMPL